MCVYVMSSRWHGRLSVILQAELSYPQEVQSSECAILPTTAEPSKVHVHTARGDGGG